MVGVSSLAIAISRIAGGSASYPIGPFLTALGMGFVILGQVVLLRNRGKPPSR